MQNYLFFGTGPKPVIEKESDKDECVYDCYIHFSSPIFNEMFAGMIYKYQVLGKEWDINFRCGINGKEDDKFISLIFGKDKNPELGKIDKSYQLLIDTSVDNVLGYAKAFENYVKNVIKDNKYYNETYAFADIYQEMITTIYGTGSKYPSHTDLSYWFCFKVKPRVLNEKDSFGDIDTVINAIKHNDMVCNYIVKFFNPNSKSFCQRVKLFCSKPLTCFPIDFDMMYDLTGYRLWDHCAISEEDPIMDKIIEE